MSTARNLEREAEAARQLREHITTIAADDPELVADMIEGETGINEAIEAALAQIAADEAHIDGISAFQSRLGARKERLRRRTELMRAAVKSAMEAADMKRKELPIGTITRAALPRQVIVTDESRIPAQFWKQPDPVLDNAAIKAALKAGDQIGGAELDNGGATLKILWS